MSSELASIIFVSILSGLAATVLGNIIWKLVEDDALKRWLLWLTICLSILVPCILWQTKHSGLVTPNYVTRDSVLNLLNADRDRNGHRVVGNDSKDENIATNDVTPSRPNFADTIKLTKSAATILPPQNDKEYVASNVVNKKFEAEDRDISLHGHWTDDRVSDFSYRMYLNVDRENRVTGKIIWTVLRVNPELYNHYRGKMGRSAEEYVQGVYNGSSNSFEIFGYSENDPDNIIDRGRYAFTILENNRVTGQTDPQGYLNGSVYY